MTRGSGDDEDDRSDVVHDLPEDVLDRHERIADEVLDRDAYDLLIGGEWVASEGGERAVARDATTGGALAEYWAGTLGDVDRAVAAASEAYAGKWGEQSPVQRGEYLEELADAVADEKPRLARLDSLEVGKPNKHSLFVDTTVVEEQLRYFAALARTADEGRRPPTSDDKHLYTREEPYGVVGAIGAWNFPAMFVAWKLGPALAAGNAVVYKPSSRAVLSTLAIAELANDVLPPGAVNVVTGAGSVVGEALTSHEDVRKLSVTGGAAAGEAAMTNAAADATPISLELGGKSPNIVFPDADLEEAVEGAVVAILFNQGQQCTAGSRLFLHEEIRDEFLAKLRDRIGELEVGDPLSPMTDVGPMVDPEHAASVREHIAAARESGGAGGTGSTGSTGSTTLYEGSVPEELADAPFVPPIVFGDVGDDDRLAREEVFGPVLSVFEFSETDTVVARANDTRYGLAAGVWTQDLERAHEVAAALEAGTVWVNTYNDLFDPAPHGGYKASGIGRELSKEALDAYRQSKTVKISLGGIPRLG
jgi:aldehyde dehydrogenase (NAD+)